MIFNISEIFEEVCRLHLTDTPTSNWLEIWLQPELSSKFFVIYMCFFISPMHAQDFKGNRKTEENIPYDSLTP